MAVIYAHAYVVEKFSHIPTLGQYIKKNNHSTQKNLCSCIILMCPYIQTRIGHVILSDINFDPMPWGENLEGNQEQNQDFYLGGYSDTFKCNSLQTCTLIRFYTNLQN